MPAKFRANPIYQALKKSDKFSLTPWQERAIESDPTSPTLVIAGAGSGKTELMAVRVLWLVANGYCRPDEVLGLTFTRKAAASLSRRISDAIKELRKTEFWPAELSEETGKPAISTYNSYANSLFRDSGSPSATSPSRCYSAKHSAINLPSR
jgi:DNA helicase II / ATP-dependent DNA helicase PcrA